MTQILLKIKGVIDVEQEMVTDAAYVLVEGQHIQQWGLIADLPALGPKVALVEHPDDYLLPGLINSHVHLCLPSDGTPFYYRQSDEMALLTAVRNMHTELQSGVTTVRDCGDQNGVLFSLRQAVEKQILTGPRLLLCGPPLTRPSDHAHFLGGVTKSIDDIPAAVIDRVQNGADFIKLIATGGSTPGSQPALASYTIPELQAAVQAAHHYDRPVSAHCRGIPGIRNVIEAGVDHIEHACFEKPDGTLEFDPELAAKMGQAGISVTPTIQLYYDAQDFLEQKKASARLTVEESQRLKSLPEVISEKCRALRGFISCGVRCVAGNDAGLPQTSFGRLWQEMDAMAGGGMTPMQALVSATRSAAEAMGLSGMIGSIKAGKQADLIMVKEDPSKDIRSLSQVQWVMKGGQIVKSL
jgi:imidazolonepropionase-like amidohydrolase